MSRQNVELVRGLQPAPDVDLVELFRDDALIGSLFDAVAPLVDPGCKCALVLPGGSSREYAGFSGLRTLWLEWLEPWESYRVEIDDVIDAGDTAVTLTRDYGRRPGMDAEVQLLGAGVWTVRDGKIVRAVFYTDRDAALEAAGLRK